MAPGAFAIKLRSADGVIAEVPAENTPSDENADDGTCEHEGEGGEPVEREEGGGAREDEPAAFPSREQKLIARVADVEEELELVRERACKLEAELEQVQETRQRLEDQLTVEVSRLSDQVRDEKEKYRTLWRLNCAQLAEYDEALAKKDEMNHILREKLMRSVVLSEHVESVRDTTLVSHASGGEPGEAVVPVPDPGRGPSHTPPRVSRREARSSHAHDGGGPSRIATRTSHEVRCLKRGHTLLIKHARQRSDRLQLLRHPAMVQVARGSYVGVEHHPSTHSMGSRTFCLKIGCLGCSVLLSGMTGVNTKP